MSDATCINGVDVESVLRAYVECALWSSSVEESGLETLRALSPDDVSERACGDWSMDRCELSADDIDVEALQSMRDDVESFLRGPEISPDASACPDCGRSITLQPSGWWSHDGMPDGCWRLSMDGPSEDGSTAHEYALDFWSTQLGDEQIGHDFWLTRNRHGAGFTDRFSGDQEGARIGRYLTDQAHPFGDSTLYIGDDGTVYAS